MKKLPSSQGLTRAIALYPTLKQFAAALGVPYQVVQQWKVNGVPAPYCPKIERLTNRIVCCESLNDEVDWAFVRAGKAGKEVSDSISQD